MNFDCGSPPPGNVKKILGVIWISASWRWLCAEFWGVFWISASWRWLNVWVIVDPISASWRWLYEKLWESKDIGRWFSSTLFLFVTNRWQKNCPMTSKNECSKASKICPLAFKTLNFRILALTYYYSYFCSNFRILAFPFPLPLPFFNFIFPRSGNPPYHFL